MRRWSLLVIFLLSGLLLHAAKAPPPGILIKPSDFTSLEQGLDKLKSKIDSLKGKPLLEDVIIFYNAVRYALDDNMFYKAEDITHSHKLLALTHKVHAVKIVFLHPAA